MVGQRLGSSDFLHLIELNSEKCVVGFILINETKLRTLYNFQSLIVSIDSIYFDLSLLKVILKSYVNALMFE